jgi:hypothetical protein
MPVNISKTRGFVISSHPYAFDAMWVSAGTEMHWKGGGQVVFHASGGGVNQVWALVEADDEGYAGLKSSGFDVQIANKGRYLDLSGESYLVDDDGAVGRDSALSTK